MVMTKEGRMAEKLCLDTCQQSGAQRMPEFFKFTKDEFIFIATCLLKGNDGWDDITVVVSLRPDLEKCARLTRVFTLTASKESWMESH